MSVTTTKPNPTTTGNNSSKVIKGSPEDRAQKSSAKVKPSKIAKSKVVSKPTAVKATKKPSERQEKSTNRKITKFLRRMEITANAVDKTNNPRFAKAQAIAKKALEELKE